VEVLEDVNLALAIWTPHGLVAPVIHHAQDLNLAGFAARRLDLMTRAEAGQLRTEDLAGATITLSNLGMFGVDTGTPLVVEGQAVIVFVGAIAERPAVVDGRVVATATMYVSIGCDHRVLDGAAAATFLDALRSELEASR
jgi:pyruvate dehydrogenase E2 component (dihydrolipoamide acetyltransferase)